MMNAAANLADAGAPQAFILQECERHVLESDGLLLGSWWLSFINDRASQQDRIIILCQNAILRFNMDFKKATVNRVTRLPIVDIEKIVVGPLNYSGETSKQVATMFGGTSRAAHGNGPNKARALRIIMNDTFVNASDRGGLFRGWMTGVGDRAGLKTCTLISRLDRFDDPDPESGPRSIHSFETALRAVLSESGRAIVHQEDVLLATSPVGVAVAATVNDIRSSFADPFGQHKGSSAALSSGANYPSSSRQTA